MYPNVAGWIELDLCCVRSRSAESEQRKRVDWFARLCLVFQILNPNIDP